MKLLNLKSKVPNFFRIMLFILIILLPTSKADAGLLNPWIGEISVTNLEVQQPLAGKIEATKFFVTINVKRPATPKPKSMGSWDAVEESQILNDATGVNGVLEPIFGYDSGECGGGGLCIQISTDKNFASGNKVYTIRPYTGLATQSVEVLTPDLKEKTKYYYRFIGEERQSTNVHYFPFKVNPQNPIDGRDPNIDDKTREKYSFTTPSKTKDLPAVTTLNPINVFVDTATLKGHAYINDDSADVYFKYGTDPKNSHLDTIDPSLLTSVTNKGINTKDGEFLITQGGLKENQIYYFMACAKNTVGESCDSAHMKYFTPVITHDLPNVTPPGKTENIYTNLAQGTPLGNKVDTADPNAFAKYFNALIKIFIGFCAILAMIMIVMGGLQYMTSELSHSKEAGKEKITNAIIGLLIALGSYALLNTINPQLLDINLNFPYATFKIPSGATFDGKPIEVDFKKDAYPAAKFASSKTGVSTAFILAIFAQETGMGANTGHCNYKTANMKPSELTALQTLAANYLKMDYTTINMSCASGGGYGGAIGLTQFIPSTWLKYRAAAASILGHEPNPWDKKLFDPLTMTAVLLKDIGGITDEYNAACKYYSGSPCKEGRVPPNKFYGDEVMGKKLSIQEQIKKIESGDLP